MKAVIFGDHPSDEPDSMALSFTVPNPLTCVSNGKFISKTDNGNNTSTYHWFVSSPINNYCVTFYAGEYSLIEKTYKSINGKEIPFKFWVLPEYYDAAQNQMDKYLKEFNFLEKICGPFPFSCEKQGWVNSPYMGMEHQTIIAYGSDFNIDYYGYDIIHLHELAHEWWGNFITANNWSDLWIHEGMATYMEVLYVESLYKDGKLTQLDYQRFLKYYISPSDDYHSHALAPEESLTAAEAFRYLDPYFRGARAIHTLRFHLGDESFFEVLKRWVYPDSTDFDNTNGRQCRLVSTEDLRISAEEITGRDLKPFFNVFFREASYPYLHLDVGENLTSFEWKTENNVALDLNIPVQVNGIDQVVEVINGKGSLAILSSDNLLVDPQKWILRGKTDITFIKDETNIITDFRLEQNYPNPFNPTTTIEYTIPKNSWVKLSVYDLLGKEIAVLESQEQSSGNYKIEFDASELTSGIYFYTMQSGDFLETRKLLLLK